MDRGDDSALWLARESASVLELTGEDRVRFLNGLVTCDVKALAPGTGTYGFFTTVQGKVLADAIVLAREDSIWLELSPGTESEVAGQLEKYKIADRVTVTPQVGLASVRVVGELADRTLAAAGLALPPPARWAHVASQWRGAEVLATRHGRLGGAAIALYLQGEQADLVVAELVAAGGVANPERLEELRVRAGIARFGVDFDRQHFPQETGAEAEAVSYSKGCYLGQEVVARIHYRGGVNHALRGLHFEAGRVPPAGAALLVEGREVGRVTSVVPGGNGSVAVGLAVLHKRGWELAQRLDLEGGGVAIVTEPGG